MSISSGSSSLVFKMLPIRTPVLLMAMMGFMAAIMLLYKLGKRISWAASNCFVLCLSCKGQKSFIIIWNYFYICTHIEVTFVIVNTLKVMFVPKILLHLFLVLSTTKIFIWLYLFNYTRSKFSLMVNNDNI